MAIFHYIEQSLLVLAKVKNIITTITYCGNDEFSGEKTDGRDSAVGKQRDGSEWVNNGISVSKPL